ncbi:MAG: DUF4167 domain-containing protein [Rhizobiaceae bacterium]
MRGRGGNNNSNNSNRKSPNPLTRSYESNGPDVKIRGTAQQIAEKYTTLWRDAQSSGDRVMAENYLQHAEHYNRLIAAAMLIQNQNQQQPRSRDDEDDDRDDQDDGQPSRDNQSRDGQHRDGQPRDEQPPRRERADSDERKGSGPQPVIEGTPAEVALEQNEMSTPKPRRARNTGQSKSNGAEEPAQPAAEATDGGDGEAAPRRARRPRRPRAKAGEGEGAAKDEAGAKAEGEMVEAADS